MYHLCVHNWLAYLRADPASGDPVIRALAEVGIDITREFPRPGSGAVVRRDGTAVVMSCGDGCQRSSNQPLTTVA